MHKLEFTLKQHTPIIHFQHDQEGATLRATELKPKLDRFLIEKYKQEIKPYIRKILSGEEFLDYKVKILQNSSPIFYLPLALKLNGNKTLNLKELIQNELEIDVSFIAPSPFFSNSDKIKYRPKSDDIDPEKTDLKSLEFAVMYKNDLIYEVRCFSETLLSKIKESVNLFFLLNNFGKRQNKGFGSYSVSKINNQVVKVNIDEQVKRLHQSNFILGAYKMDSNNHFLSKFEKIDSVWKLLKSGRNFGGYEKSDLFNYFYNKSPKIRWEKRAIKKHLKENRVNVFDALKYDDKNSNENRILTLNDTENNHFYIRGLLGVAEHYEFGTKYSSDKVLVKISDSLSTSNNERDKENAIDRFKAPITFKIIDNAIFLFVFQIPEKLSIINANQNRFFNFNLESKVQRQTINSYLFRLAIPQNFNVCDFLDSMKIETKTGSISLKSVAQHHGFTKITPNHHAN